MLFRLLVIIPILVNSIFGANYQHQPFSNDAEVEYLTIEQIEPFYEPQNGLYYRQFNTKSSKSTVDGVVLVPSISYSENRFYTGGKSAYGKKEQIFLRSFLEGEDQGLYFTKQGDTESYFYRSAYKISDYGLMGPGPIYVYSTDLNLDNEPDYIIMKYSGGSGMASGNCNVAFYLSKTDEWGVNYRMFLVHSMFPDPEDFVILDGKPAFIHCEFQYGPICNDGKGHNFFVYNVLTFDDGEVQIANENHKEFPKTIWYSFKPNSKETTLLNDEQKEQLVNNSIPVIMESKSEIAFEWRPGLQALINAFKSGNKERIIRHLDVNFSIGNQFFIQNDQDLNKYWDYIVSPEIVDVISNSTVNDFFQAGWRGVFHREINLQSDDPNYGIFLCYENTGRREKLSKRLKDNVRSYMHKSVSDYVEIWCDYTTSRHRVIVQTVDKDNLDKKEDEETFRLVLWYKGQTIDDEPILIINGEKSYEVYGSGGYWTMKFLSENDRTYHIENSPKWGMIFKVYWDFIDGDFDENNIIYCDDLDSTRYRIEEWDYLAALDYNPNKHLIVDFEGTHQGKYKISAIVEPWQARMSDGVDCYAKYIVKNIETGKMCFFDHYNLHLPIADLKPYLINEMDSDGGPIYGVFTGVKNSEQFKMVLKNVPNPDPLKRWSAYDIIDGEWIYNSVRADFSGKYFSFIDIDFDGVEELIVTNHFGSQRHRTGFDVYDLDILDEDYDGEEYRSIFEIKEILNKQHEPLDYLDEGSVIDLANKFISNHSSGGAGDSHVTDFRWFEGGRYDGWMPVKREGARDGKIFKHEYKHRPESYVEDGYYWGADMYVEDGWRTNKIDVIDDSD